MTNLMFIHGMFLNPKSWQPWKQFFSARGYNCIAPAWPLHEGEPEQLRAAPPSGLGELHLDVVIDKIKEAATPYEEDLVLIGHSGLLQEQRRDESDEAWRQNAVNDSRNVLRDCMGDTGKIDVDAPHDPLLLISAEKDEIIPAGLCEKNANAYEDKGSLVSYREFKNRSHFICGEPDWEEVATHIADWIDLHSSSKAVPPQRRVG